MGSRTLAERAVFTEQRGRADAAVARFRNGKRRVPHVLHELSRVEAAREPRTRRDAARARRGRGRRCHGRGTRQDHGRDRDCRRQHRREARVRSELGADHTINYTTQDLRERIKEITGGKGVDVVYDPVGGPFTEPALRSLAWKGRFLVIGFAAGEIPRIPINLALLKGASIVGVFFGAFSKREPEAQRAERRRALADVRVRTTQGRRSARCTNWSTTPGRSRRSNNAAPRARS